jgi:hypothetical protein
MAQARTAPVLLGLVRWLACAGFQLLIVFIAAKKAATSTVEAFLMGRAAPPQAPQCRVS